MHKRQGLSSHLVLVFRMLSLARHIRPRVIHGYLGGNLYALLLSRFTRASCVWGIRRTSADPGKMNWRSRLATRITKWLSYLVQLIIFNSQAGRSNHERMGFRARRHVVIPNGIDVGRFHPDKSAGIAWRMRYDLEIDRPLLGIVGRLHPVKDHDTFLRAVALAIQHHPEMRAVCIGSGSSAGLQIQEKALGVKGYVYWVGLCTDMPVAYNALDILALTSTDEGFPNVVGEAMASGVPCVVTRAGDAEDIVGNTGLSAAVGDAAGIASAISMLLAESHEARVLRGSAARTRICDNYSVQALAERTQRVLEELVWGKGMGKQ
jgi:glycosyltransferase involved in cell wall biosynthesis